MFIVFLISYRTIDIYDVKSFAYLDLIDFTLIYQPYKEAERKKAGRAKHAVTLMHVIFSRLMILTVTQHQTASIIFLLIKTRMYVSSTHDRNK